MFFKRCPPWFQVEVAWFMYDLRGGLSATPFAVICGRDAASFVESDRKSLGIGVANLLSDMGDTQRRVQQKVLCSLHTAIEQVLLETCPNLLFEQHADITDRVMEPSRQIEECHEFPMGRVARTERSVARHAECRMDCQDSSAPQRTAYRNRLFCLFGTSAG